MASGAQPAHAQPKGAAAKVPSTIGRAAAPLAPDRNVVRRQRQPVAPLDCSGNVIYQIQRAGTGATTGRLNAVDVSGMTPGSTSPVPATEATSALIPQTNPGANALGVTDGGLGAWAIAPQAPGGSGTTLVFTLRFFDTTTGEWTSREVSVGTAGRLPAGVTAATIRSGGIVAGAIDPLSGNFYWAHLANAPTNAVTIFGYNTTTNQSIGVVGTARVPQTVPASGSTNGDIAFDRGGNMFIVSNTGTNAALGVIAGPLPTTQPSTTPVLEDSHLTDFSNTASNAYNGIAFNSTGELFIEWSTGTGADADTIIQKVNPQSGAVIAGPSTVNFATAGGGIGVDLAACSTPPSLQLRKNVINRLAPTDQFNLAITGGEITDGNTATTEGTDTGVQDQTAGPVVGRTSQTYTFTETAAGTTDLDDYTITWECLDEGADNEVVDSGTGRTFTFSPSAGQAILCTFTNGAPQITLDKTASPDEVAAVGQQITFTFTVTNSGNVTLSDITLVDDVFGTINCPETELAPGEHMECASTHTTTQADLDRGFIFNTAAVTGDSPTGERVTDSDRVTVELSKKQPTPPTTPAAPGGPLPRTGTNIGWWLPALAAGLLICGVGLVLATRRLIHRNRDRTA